MDIPIYHITHIKNLEGILSSYALFCDTKINSMKIDVKSFSKPDLKSERTRVIVPICEGGVLADYVPFFFTNRPPMLYSIKYYHGSEPQKKYLHLVSSISKISHSSLRFCYTDGHGIMRYTSFSDDLDHIDDFIDWETIHSTSWGDSFNDGDRKRRKQAEFLVYGMVPWDCIESISVIDNNMKEKVEKIFENYSLNYSVPIQVKPNWYYL